MKKTPGQEMVDQITAKIEDATGQKIFTLRIINDDNKEIELLVALENKEMIHGKITFPEPDGNDEIAIRFQGNYI